MTRHHVRILAIAMLIPFTLLTAWAVFEHGATGIFEYQLQTSAGLQVWVDLVIAMVLFLCWMFPDARRHGRNPWPWVVITLVAGSFGPLLYLAAGRTQQESV